MDLSQYYQALSKQNQNNIDLIVLHHTGDKSDMTIEQMDEIHRNRPNDPFLCVGVHAVIRKKLNINNKNRTIIQFGRPTWAIGAHAYGANLNSLGVETCGNFMIEKPSAEQINSIIELFTLWAKKCPNIKYISAHRDINYTQCCGDNLYSKLPYIIKQVSKNVGRKLEQYIANPRLG
jgi:N-acetyl-anhydromuramyl-L-alanine amidase AmpD